MKRGIIGSGLLGGLIMLSAQAGHSAPPAAAPAPGAPAPAKLETYRDWIIGCDNGGTCQASSLTPEADSGSDSAVILVVQRDAGATAQPKLSIDFSEQLKGVVDIMVDGTKVGSAPLKDSSAQLSGTPAFAAISALAKGNQIALNINGKRVGHASLSGSSAALRFMDAKQGRAGTVTALVAKGPLGATAIKPPPDLPVVARALVPVGQKGAPLWADELARANTLTNCTGENDPKLDTPVYPLGGNKSLILLACGAGAYNYMAVPLIGTGMPGRRTLTLARFDYKPGWGDDDAHPMLVNADWSDKQSLLSSYAKGRGLGDCGSAESYVWDGAMFRLVEATSMGECRGSWEWITVWRAKVVVKK